MHFYTTDFFTVKQNFVPEFKHTCTSKSNFYQYRKSSIKPPRGLFISSPFESGGGGVGGLTETGGLFNLETTMVSVLPKELECKVEKLKYKKC